VLGDLEFPILRLDADCTGVARRATVLEQFAAAPAGVLVGTQMVAKGHDFPDITLGVVLDADQTLRFPDFRAEERTFSLITQLAGRAGRGDRASRVLVQTLAPEARAIAFAGSHDADGFLEGELGRRNVLGYPPYATLIRLVCSAPREGDAGAVAAALRAQIACPQADLLGPAPLFRRRGRFRSQIVLKSTDRRAAIAAVSSAVDSIARTAAKRAVTVSVDVDPQ
jgi:primosomal protein N' (replication factor Y)